MPATLRNAANPQHYVPRGYNSLVRGCVVAQTGNHLTGSTTWYLSCFFNNAIYITKVSPPPIELNGIELHRTNEINICYSSKKKRWMFKIS